MKKKIFKMTIVYLIAFATFCNAAVVSDNDGAAFVTKAEFESLKQNFAEQIMNYNTSIDSKVDGAIASYLAGVRLTEEPKNLYDEYVKYTTVNPIFMNSISAGSASTNRVFIRALITERLKLCNNLKTLTFRGGSSRGYVMCGIFDDLSGAWTTDWDSKSVRYLTSDTRNVAFGTMGWTKTNGWNSTKYPATYGTIEYSQQNTDDTEGSGTKWIYQYKNGFRTLKYYAKECYIDTTFDYSGLYYDNHVLSGSSNAYFANDGKKITRKLTVLSVKAKGGGTTTAGTPITSTQTSDGAYVEAKSNIVKNNDGTNYQNIFFCLETDKSLYTINEDYEGTETDTYTTYTIPASTFTDTYTNTAGSQVQTNNVTSNTFKYANLTMNDEIKNASEFCNNAATMITGEQVKVGGGMPVIETYDNDQDLNVKLKLKCNTNAVCELRFADKQFELGVAPTGSLLKTVDVTANQSNYADVDLSLGKKGLVYMFVKNKTNNDSVELLDFDIKVK